MTLPEVQALQRYWIKCPPVHLLVKAFVGYEPGSLTPVSRGTNADAGYAESDPGAEAYINRVDAAEFDAVLQSFGLPVSPPHGSRPH